MPIQICKDQAKSFQSVNLSIIDIDIIYLFHIFYTFTVRMTNHDLVGKKPDSDEVLLRKNSLSASC